MELPQPKPLATAYGKRLRSARLARGWTQAGLAERIGMVDHASGACMSRYETGQHEPASATSEALATAPGLPVAYFHAISDLLAEVILLVSKLPASKQKEALKQLREIAEAAGSCSALVLHRINRAYLRGLAMGHWRCVARPNGASARRGALLGIEVDGHIANLNLMSKR
ncbi:helix-turn-helix domain-containing protein [Xanthomonas campestris]|uniref:helix-turn-helix domain-containing protein n=1 Tax=Xanthomonas campestris TaxID=339 RepID=UPI001E57A775|nr:helix-turn-helix transcriptional regulator [Xanthomonas campestris]MCC5098186.1 helix-turn-helix domain-containing protein [Xanthomonas campestris]MEA9593196.1 helix-turn-helix transcriptional regulator [Xanthomonas campestris]MEA9638378.1 helix-turn-helix transcriptional regulator [Xanthomonas campestris]MEA9647490.1 helix-turn-helix transcriptional regulator [Xanthomonas campestris WHRI 8523]MEA9665976.1 helix-turn-helix transcriptional regulator [Xanthomonas campestris]